MSATDTFHNPKFNHNCAQAVAYEWREQIADPQVVEKMAQCGGGRAPEGICGALYAAQLVVPDKAEAIAEAFRKEVGALTCREIKGVCKTPCPVCVAAADALVAQLLEKTSR